MKVNYGLFGQGLGDQRLILQPHYPNLLFRIVSHDRYFKTTTALHSLTLLQHVVSNKAKRFYDSYLVHPL